LNFIKEENMARFEGTRMDSGERFPAIDFETLPGTGLHLPEGLGDGYKVLLVYRGQW
jgi:hypothetical protein